jgi:DNA-binding response OmpR family regulator
MTKVIVVDDNPAIGTMIARMLDETEFNCTILTSAENLVQRLQDDPIDLLITDILMPGVEGIELILSVQAAFPALPIVAMSGGGNAIGMDVLRNAQQLGAKVVLAKPFTRGELLATMRGALQG